MTKTLEATRFSIQPIGKVRENASIRFQGEWWRKYTGMYNAIMLIGEFNQTFKEVSSNTMVGIAVIK